MTPGARIAAAIELLTEIDAGRDPGQQIHRVQGKRRRAFFGGRYALPRPLPPAAPHEERC